MVDTIRSLSALQALLADNTSGDISPQDVRDFLVSALPYGRAATLVVAPSTASQLIKNGADAVCSGADDQYTIQTEYDALTSGGTLVLLAGTYEFSAPLYIDKEYTTLECERGVWIQFDGVTDSVPIIAMGFSNTAILNPRIRGNTWKGYRSGNKDGGIGIAVGGEAVERTNTFASTAVNTTAETITIIAHGLEDGDTVGVTNNGGSIPGGLTEGKFYFVVNKTSDTFQVSLTSGGGPINLTAQGSGTNDLVTGNTPHSAMVIDPRITNCVIAIDFGISGGSSAGDNFLLGGHIAGCGTGIRSRGFVNRLYTPNIAQCGRGIHVTAIRNSSKIEVFGATINQYGINAIQVDGGKNSYFSQIWTEHTSQQYEDAVSGGAVEENATEAILIGTTTSGDIPTGVVFEGTTNLHQIKAADGTREVDAVRIIQAQNLRIDSLLFSTNGELPTRALIREDADNTAAKSGVNNRVKKIEFWPGTIPASIVVTSLGGSGEIIVEQPPDVSGSIKGRTVGGNVNVADADYTIFVDGSTYFSKQRNGNVPVVSTTLKDVTDDIELAGSGTSIHFASGTFDFGTDNWTFNSLDDLVISGEGIGITIVSNDSDAVADTEPLSFTNCNRIVVRDMTISAGGAAEATSDALDFDDGNDCLVERVFILLSRARGIVFDGKDGGSTRNVIRDCIITGTKGVSPGVGDGIRLLGCDHTDIVNCHIYETANHGISIAKSSGGGGVKSDHNRVIGGTIRQAGRDGINILSSDYNTILGVSIENSGDETSGRSGVRIETTNAIAADHNKIIGVTAIDTGDDTQKWGVNVDPTLPAEANDNVVTGCVVDGDQVSGGAAIKDNGTRTIIRNNPGFRAPGEVVTLTKIIDHADLIDNLDLTARIDFDDTIPAGSIIQAVRVDFTEAWNSDETTSLTMMIGIPTDLDDFNLTIDPGEDIHNTTTDVFWFEKDCQDPVVIADVIPRVTFTEDSDGTQIISGTNATGKVTISITYLKA